MTEQPGTQKAAALAYRAEQVLAAVTALLDETAGMDAETTPEEAATLLYAVRHTAGELRKVDTAITTSVTARWSPSNRPHIIDGLPAVTIRRTPKSVRWNDEGAAAAVVDAHIARDHPDGDFPPPWEVQRWFLDAAGIGYWRTTDLRSLGVDPDDYRTFTRGNLVVDFG